MEGGEGAPGVHLGGGEVGAIGEVEGFGGGHGCWGGGVDVGSGVGVLVRREGGLGLKILSFW